MGLMIHKHSHTKHASHRHHHKAAAMSHRVEALLKEFITVLTEASYQVAIKCGFRGTFIVFLSDFQEALEKIIQKDHKKFEQSNN
jgi:hypothetical protein